jgi:tRNA modification GTPase
VAAAYGHCRAAAELAHAGQPPELLAVELRLALDALGQLVGAVYTEDLLGRVFSQFCIGK